MILIFNGSQFNTEYLGGVEDEVFEMEVRVVSLLGINFTSNNKLETGLDYRTTRSSLTPLFTTFGLL